MPTTTYNNWKAITYAKTWCGQQNNVCGTYLRGAGKSDCAHFLAHCLDAGGITVPDVDHTGMCPQGLAVRNPLILTTLRSLAGMYDNVVEIGLADAIVGDVGFLDMAWPTHAFMICEPFNLGDPLLAPKVYAHSANHCCERLDTKWRQWLTSMFRLADG